MPTVSVIIHTYNNEKFIAETVASVLNQTYKDYEIIVVSEI
jgi:teichuronic acid biosynthesis glycosyltransferase TuaG